MDTLQRITQTIEPSLESMGYALVLVKLSDAERRKTLTIMAERKDDAVMSFDDCTQISRTIGALLEVEDPINTAYDLEVCSPGIDRPLTRLKDFSRYAGYQAKIETQLPINGRRRFKGVIEAPQGEQIKMKMPEGDVEIGFQNIRTAKLLMTDELMAEFLKKKK